MPLKEVTDDALASIVEQNRRVQSAFDEHVAAKEAAKIAREEYDAAVDRLRAMIAEAGEPNLYRADTA